ncbi:MAG TPA: M48 family metalloprotease, partial [Thermoanaerobaculia bacterium]
FLKFSRDLETQADVRGAQILAASGYSPSDMVSFFHQLEKVDKSRKTTWLSHHPAPPDRIARINKEAQLLRVTTTPTTNVAELNNVKSNLRRHGTAPTMAQIAQGTTSASNLPPMTSSTGGSSAIGRVEAPSNRFRTYTARSGVFRIQYPENWRVYEGGATAVTIAPQGGVGEVGGRTEVVYGVMVDHYDPFGNSGRNYLRNGTSGRSTTLQAATNDLLAQIQQGSPHLRMVRNSAQQIDLDGRTGIAASLSGRNPNTGVTERVTVVTRQLPDEHLIYMLFVTPEQDAKNYSRVLSQMVQSIQVDETRRH